MATHFSILAWKIPWTEEPGRATVHGVAKESDTTEYTHTHTHKHTHAALKLPRPFQENNFLLSSHLEERKPF